MDYCYLHLCLTMDAKQTTFSHIDAETGNAAMVDVSSKAVTKRIATAQAVVVLGEEITQLLHNNDIQTKKGSVFQTAIIAGTMAVKKTSELIPLCHPMMIEDCRISTEVNERGEVV